jgi:hypothetical protein
MNKIKLAFILLAGLVFGACGSDDDGGNNNNNNVKYTETAVSEAPVWGIDWSFNQERPVWTKPDAGSYGNWTIMMVQLEETLRPFASDEDMMAIFVNGELRGLATPAEGTVKNGNAAFLMKVYGNETGTETVNVSLQYYSKRLNQIFNLSENISLNSDESTGIDEDYIPLFTLGSPKYPIVKTVGAESYLTKVSIPFDDGNIVGAFVGNECRGLAKLSTSGNTSLVIYGRTAGETVTLKYYDAENGILYTIPDALKM